MADQNITEQLVEFLRSEKVNFIPLSKLPTSLKSSLGLKDNAKVGEIEKALAPYLGEKLEIQKKGRSLCLYLTQPPDTEEGAKPLDTEQLVEFLRSEKVNFILLSKLPTSLKSSLGLKDNAKVGEIGKALAPYLGEKLEIQTRGKSLYLCLVQSLEETILHLLGSKVGETFKQLKQKTSAEGNELRDLLNLLVDKGLIYIKLSQDFQPCVYRASAEVPKSTPAAPQIKEEPRTEEQFRAAFRELERGKIFVDIYALRRRLNWSRGEFDAMLQKLRNAGTIHLYAGDITTMTPDEIEDGFVDKNGFRMGSMTWNQ
jgi:hypothetical protein